MNRSGTKSTWAKVNMVRTYDRGDEGLKGMSGDEGGWGTRA